MVSHRCALYSRMQRDYLARLPSLLMSFHKMQAQQMVSKIDITVYDHALRLFFSLLPASIDYNVFSTMVEFHPGVAEIACVNVSILQDEALERVEYFYVAAVPNGMIGTPVGGDSCEVAIIDVNGMLISNRL